MSESYDILVIDDESVVIDSVVKVAEAEGYTVDSARTASAALAKLNSNAYRMIISDVMMSGMDGFRFLAEIRSIGIKTPVIMTTGLSTVQNAVKSLLAGAIGFLPKPFTVGELMSRIRRGFKYAELLGRLETGELAESDLFEGCCDEYRRLGYASWVKAEALGVVSVGVMGHFLRTIDPICRVDLLDPGEQIFQGNHCAGFATAKLLVHRLLSPISGRIIARNEAVLADNQLLERDPYHDGWLYKVLPDNLDEEIKLLGPCAGM